MSRTVRCLTSYIARRIRRRWKSFEEVDCENGWWWWWKHQFVASQIRFLKTCLRLKLTPNFVNCRIECDSAPVRSGLQQWLTKKWIRLQIRRWYGKLNSSTKILDTVHLNIAVKIINEEMDRFLQFISSKKCVAGDQVDKKNRKIESLLSKRRTIVNRENGSKSQVFNYYPRWKFRPITSLQGENSLATSA